MNRSSLLILTYSIYFQEEERHIKLMEARKAAEQSLTSKREEERAAKDREEMEAEKALKAQVTRKNVVEWLNHFTILIYNV